MRAFSEIRLLLSKIHLEDPGSQEVES